MGSVIVPVILGVLILALGFSNTKGNISSVHWYHRTRVTEEDKLPFSRMIGLGTIIIGASLVIFGCLAFITEKTQSEKFVTIGTVVVIIGIVAGLAVSLYAIFKYNKGIF